MSVSLDEVNLLIYKYLKESGFSHTAYVFGTESLIGSSNSSKNQIPSGALVSILQNSLGYLRYEKSIKLSQEKGDSEIIDSIKNLEQLHPEPEIVASKNSEKDTSISINIDIIKSKIINSLDPIILSPEVAYILTGHPQAVYTSCWSTSGDILITGGGDSSGILWDINDGQPVSQKSLEMKSSGDGIDRDITSIDINRNGSLIAVGSFFKTISIYDRNGIPKYSLDGHDSSVFVVKFNPSGSLLCTGSADHSCIVWDPSKGALIRRFSFHRDTILDIAWKNDICFASASADHKIYIQTVTGSTVRLDGHTDQVTSLAWNSNGTLILSGSADRSIRLWRDDGSCIFVFQGHNGVISTVRWQPKCQHVFASASLDGTLRLWNVISHTCYSILKEHTNEIVTMGFSPTGEYIASGGVDSRVVISRVHDGALMVCIQGNSEVIDLCWDPKGRILTSCFEDSTVALIQASKFLK